MTPTLKRVARLGRDRRGVASAEYAVMAVGIVIVVGAAVLTLADPNTSALVVLGNTLSATIADMINSFGTTR